MYESELPAYAINISMQKRDGARPFMGVMTHEVLRRSRRGSGYVRPALVFIYCGQI